MYFFEMKIEGSSDTGRRPGLLNHCTLHVE